MHCTNCGKELNEGAKFCGGCGQKPKEVEGVVVTSQEKIVEPQQNQIKKEAPLKEQSATVVTNNQPTQPKDGREIMSTGAYVGAIILMSIPIIGWIIAIIWACGGTKKVNKKNLARAMIILFVIMLVISILFGVLIKLAFDAIVDMLNESGILDSEAFESLNEALEQLQSINLNELNVQDTQGL